MIYAICVFCGGYLDRDESICRQCGTDNNPGAEAEERFDISDIDLDRLNPWSIIKHEIVEKYCGAYTTILQRQPWVRRFVYIDAFAGAGIAVDAGSEDLIEAGALRALSVKPPFSEYHLIEEDPEKVALLRHLTRDRSDVQIHPGDYRAHLPGLLDRCRYHDFARGLCFLDPYGLSVDYSLLKQIAALKTVEIFFNFMLVGVNRNVLWRMNPSKISPARKALMARVWGHDHWVDELYERQPTLFGDVQKKVSNAQVVEAYRQRLLAAGFAHVPQPIAMKNSRNAAVYYLFFCSPKAVAGDIVRDVFDKYRGN